MSHHQIKQSILTITDFAIAKITIHHINCRMVNPNSSQQSSANITISNRAKKARFIVHDKCNMKA